ncbi:efflux RND transporter permease subunit [Chelatococcus reniformis]|uniref:Efflux pump membrane transporter n=1 Tax=Chelatococcus reniformis TaxID=1494448 RepID=A0A916TZP8_9HYPH|nr:multidrug efflux RND transporter permease subunit [Chelatococcus reniformis]GGC48523.1 transporter [Chelatococcus reniformis]
MISSFFIARPQLAIVMSVVITIAGLLCLLVIPVAQYPAITPPVVQVTASYPGADASTIAQTVGAPIEQQVNGVEGMMYMSSTSSSAGVYTLAVTFAVGTDPDIAQVNTQNRVALATSQLPSIVNALGVQVQQQSTSMLGVIAIYSDDPKQDPVFISNYTSINLQPAVSRVPGVGAATLFGALNYSMRVWLDADRMAALSLTPIDISNAIQNQNIQASLGQIGAPPIADTQVMQYTIETKGRLITPDDFSNIILRTGADGAILRIRDVARVELGAQSYAQSSLLNGRPAICLAVYQLPNANALQVMQGVEQRLKELEPRFPHGLKARVVYDSTLFVSASVNEIVKTLAITAVIVLLVVFLFLQDLRATIVPAVTIPVSLIGVFIVYQASGFSANTISLFALVLAIGLVVDDAIVVVENVQRIIEQEGLPARAATLKAMGQVTGPIVSTTLVLFAIFAPVAFFPGIVGELYRQFAVTITAAVAISAINALTLSPALCALVLRPLKPHRGPLAWFNRGLEHTRSGYTRVSGALARRSLVGALIIVAAGGATAYMFGKLPTSFLPTEDQGVLFVDVELPDAAALPRTDKVLAEVDRIARDVPGVADVITVSGFSLLTGSPASNSGLAVVVLKPWSERRTLATSMFGIYERLHGEYAALAGANVLPFPPPAIPGLGTTGGFDFRLEALEGQSPEELATATRSLVIAANQDPRISRAYSTYSASVPRIFMDIDRSKTESLGVSVSDVFTTMQAMLGSLYINQFNYLGRSFQVNIQADAKYRAKINDISRLYVRNAVGDMVPISTLAVPRERVGADLIYQYNQYPSAQISGDAAATASSGEAMAAMAGAFNKVLPTGYNFEWSSLSFQEASQTPGTVLFILGLSMVFGYLFLVGLYESWLVPFAVIASVAIAALGAVLTVSLLKLGNDIYTQIGLLLLIGLAAKNAILIVEFARDERAAGRSRYDAAVDAMHKRFRAVLMTALAFIIGLLPLVLSTGAGAVSRIHLGFAVLGGMLAATFFGILLVPSLYVLFQRIEDGLLRRREGAPADA